MFTIFNLGDTIGRGIAGQPFAILSPLGAKIWTYARTIFLATYFLIAFKVKPDWLFDSDWFIITNTALFGITNGYCSTLCAVLSPGTVPEKLRQETGAMIGTVIIIGITVGSAIAMGVGPIVDLAPPK